MNVPITILKDSNENEFSPLVDIDNVYAPNGMSMTSYIPKPSRIILATDGSMINDNFSIPGVSESTPNNPNRSR